jgi:hypothetical protein
MIIIYNIFGKSRKLKGIDKIYVISLKGSKRKENIINEFEKIGINNYEFIHPINFNIDNINLDRLKNIIPENINDVDDKLKDGNKFRLGTLSLSIITYYLFYKAKKLDKTILVLEDNIEFADNFVEKYNRFYENLPDKNWDILDLHTFNNQDKTMCPTYFKNLKNIYPNMILTNDRPIINNYVLLGCNEGAGSKAYIINSKSYKKLPKLPIKYPADGIKNWLSSYWQGGISYMPVEELIKVSDKFKSERISVDNLEKNNNYIKLNNDEIKEIINNLLDK